VYRISDGAIVKRSLGLAGHLINRAGQACLIGAFFAGLFGLVSIYSDALRDPRYLDGWILAGGMALQLGFHAAIKTDRLSPKSVKRWRKLHILVGYLLIGVFLSHSDFSLPDTGFGWALWTGFALVTLSGIFGIYLAWSLRAKGDSDERLSYDQIPARLAELARDAEGIVAAPDPNAAAMVLPAPSYDAWIIDLYTDHLQSFFAGHRNFSSHLIGSQRPLKHLTDEISNLSRYVDRQGQEKLAEISHLVIEKDRLDRARVHFWLGKGWLFVHVPVTYALIVLSILHILVVYSFSPGVR
jgi:hypothetical protein